MPKTVIAMMMTPAGQSAVEAATKRNGRVFAAYIVLLLVTALLVAYFTWLTWDSGNKVQDAVQGDANARIEEAKATAAKADERSKTLEKDNLTLRSDLNTQVGQVAGLQTDAANAKAAQQQVEIELEKQRTIAAIAEKDLAALKATVTPRRLTPEQVENLAKSLSGEPKGVVSIMCVMGDGEGNAFATQIVTVLKSAGWTMTGGGVTQAAFGGGDPTGFGIIVRSAITAPPYAGRLQRAFFSVGIPLAGAEIPSLAEGTVQIVVGHKPSPKL